MIDLGLPSGIFWACCNVDTNHPENQSPTNYGGYYAWAETETKSQYNDDTYLYFNRGDYKYFGNISGTQYDVAHVKWGDSWQMPTSAQLNELFNNCTYEWSTVNDVNGYKFYGPNGGCIFLPAAGYGYYGSIRDRGYDGHYWASGQFAICNSTNLYFTPYDVYTSFAYSFEKGFSVRPVATLQLSSTGFALNVGSQQTVSITSGSGSYNAESSDTNVASVKINGETLVVSAVEVGSATITVSDTKSGVKTYIEVNALQICPDNQHPHMIDLGLPSGTKWACCNVDPDATKQSPTNYGGYYAWGETETKSTYDWSSYTHCNGSRNTCHDLGSNIAGTEFDVAYVKWGEEWQMPSPSQLYELRNCSSTWTMLDGVYGRTFTGSNGNCIFIPAAGYCYLNENLYDSGSSGNYWSSMLDTYESDYDVSEYGQSLIIDIGKTNPDFDSRVVGLSIRPVVRN